MRNAGQAQPKMSRLKVFYIIISIGALFSKVSSTEDKKRRSIPGRSTQHWQDDYKAKLDNEDESDGDVDDTVWDMFWWGLHAPPIPAKTMICSAKLHCCSPSLLARALCRVGQWP